MKNLDVGILGHLDLDADMWSFIGEGRVLLSCRDRTGRDGAAFLGLLAGVRVIDTSTTLKVTGPQGGSLTGSEQKLGWVDGLVGIRFRVPLGSPRFGLEGRADVAGFGSDVTWNLLGGLDVSVGKHWVLGAGYRHMHIDYDKGQGLDRKAFKEAFHGRRVRRPKRAVSALPPRDQLAQPGGGSQGGHGRRPRRSLRQTPGEAVARQYSRRREAPLHGLPGRLPLRLGHDGQLRVLEAPAAARGPPGIDRSMASSSSTGPGWTCGT